MLQEIKRLYAIHEKAKAYIKKNRFNHAIGEMTLDDDIEYQRQRDLKRETKKEIYKLINQL